MPSSKKPKQKSRGGGKYKIKEDRTKNMVFWNDMHRLPESVKKALYELHPEILDRDHNVDEELPIEKEFYKEPK